MVDLAGLKEATLLADADGRVRDAQRAAERLVLAATNSGDLRDHVDSLLILAWILRHTRDARQLRRARDAARVAVGLTGTPGLQTGTKLSAHAELEFAECLVESGRLGSGIRAALRWRTDDDANIAGWAWTVLGKARFAQGRTPEAIGALSNAAAEFQRAPGVRRVYGSRVVLARALTKSGELRHGAELLEADLDYWSALGTPPRLRILHHLALVENRRLRGDIAEAHELLRSVQALLKSRAELEDLWIRFHQHAAFCALEWRQREEARKHFRLAEQARATLSEDGPDRPAVGVVPALSPVQRLGAAHSVVDRRLHDELALAADELADGLGDALDAVAPGQTHINAVELLVREAERSVWPRSGPAPRPLQPGVVQELIALLDDLTADPEDRRREAVLLVRAGEVLAAGAEPNVAAERLLRRALVRLARLAGTELVEARASSALARVLRADGRPEDGLAHALRAVRTLDAERFEMGHERVRARWRKAQGPAYELAIELAQQCDRPEIAADLIIASRAAGVVSASGERLVPVPQLHYIDGSVSSLTGPGDCFFL
ncbi:hypothetical protein [Granulicoccus sp. GXG6511]|uniref:hypothetical protein n=1 Tax=Granulicoccus sp. GXG6511 TaxID=3381351 RepID=UPI003D7ED6FC